MAEIQLDNLEGSVTKLKSAYEGLQITIANKVTPELKKMVDTATEGVTLINALLQGNTELARSILAGDRGSLTRDTLPDYIKEAHGIGHGYGTISSSGHTSYGGGMDLETPSSVTNNFYVENLKDVDQLMDMIENDNRRRRMNP